MSIVYTCNTGVSGQCSHTIQAYDSWSVWSMFSYNTSVRLVECLVNVLIQYKRMTRMRRENPFTIHPQLYATIMNTGQYLSSGILKQILINKMMYNTMKMFLWRESFTQIIQRQLKQLIIFNKLLHVYTNRQNISKYELLHRTPICAINLI